jgi:hypothetical protein
MLTGFQKAVLCIVGFTIDMGMVAFGPVPLGPLFMLSALCFGIGAGCFLVLDILEARRAARKQSNRYQEWKEKCKRE